MLINKGHNCRLPSAVQAQTKCHSYNLTSIHSSGYMQGMAIEKESYASFEGCLHCLGQKIPVAPKTHQINRDGCVMNKEKEKHHPSVC